MRIDVLTLFPETFDPLLASSIIGRGVRAGLVDVRCMNFREFTCDPHRSVDDKPFGGGPGMVLMCQPVFDALEHIEAEQVGTPVRVLLTPQGQELHARIEADFLEEHKRLLGDLDPEVRQAISNLIGRLAREASERFSRVDGSCCKAQ